MPNFAGAQDLTDIGRRMERVADSVNEDRALAYVPAPPGQRWKIDKRWVEFECGCRAERVAPNPAFDAFVRPFDPVIFRGLPQQAVYEGTCDFHAPSMNVYVHFGRFADFKQWKANRRPLLMGKARA